MIRPEPCGSMWCSARRMPQKVDQTFHLQGQLERLVGELGDRGVVVGAAGVVDQDVEPAEALDRRVDERPRRPSRSVTSPATKCTRSGAPSCGGDLGAALGRPAVDADRRPLAQVGLARWRARCPSCRRSRRRRVPASAVPAPLRSVLVPSATLVLQGPCPAAARPSRVWVSRVPLQSGCPGARSTPMLGSPTAPARRNACRARDRRRRPPGRADPPVVLAATYRLLAEHGLAGATVEKVDGVQRGVPAARSTGTGPTRPTSTSRR